MKLQGMRQKERQWHKHIYSGLAEASKDQSPIATQSESYSTPPLPPPPANQSRSSHSPPQLSAESQLSVLHPPPNITATMRNIDSPAQQLPEETAHLLSPPPPQHQPAPTDVSGTQTQSVMQSNQAEKRDITMSGGGMSNDQLQPQSQPPVPATSSTPTAPSAHTSTSNNINNAPSTPIPQVRPGGAPARVYMNEKIVPYLLEGMKTLAKEQ
ncbi:compass component sdc1 [Blastomyces parvus]|uniref:Compass component sdc1 n=1 Tax=Blastomyces parvus TaxID=2060905 RepID=A0A2B7XL90_9EURO|nr:compass component sdc1 [Blastomyces parvus]